MAVKGEASRRRKSRKTVAAKKHAKTVSSNNRRLLKLLDEFLTKPHNHAAFWDEFDRDLRENRTKFRLFDG